jgi:basic membrane protein A
MGLFWIAGSGDIQKQQGTMRVGLVFDVGGRGDKSFNDSAYLGLMRAKKDFKVAVEYIEPGDGSDRESAIRILASRGFDLIISTGFIFTDDVTRVALEYPQLKFVCVDYALKTDKQGQIIPPPPNVAALKFREEEGSFVVGALAGLVSKGRTLGFVGGMDIPLIRRFEAGYRQGIQHVCPSCRVLANYAGVTSHAFKDPSKGKELALSQYRNGADIIFHASGSTGLGVFEAARVAKRLAIGVDSDQFHEAPGFILTSMVKRVDNAIYHTIQKMTQVNFVGGIHSFGLAEDGVGYVYDHNNRKLIPDAVYTRLEEIKQNIISRKIRINIDGI